MEFGLSQEQQDVQQLARKILADQVTPDSLSRYDEFDSPRFDQALWQQLAAAGLLGIGVQERYGGMGFGFMELALFVEEVGRSIAPVPAISHCVSALLPIARFGSDEMKEAILPAAITGELLVTAALAEPLNEDPADPHAMRALREGDTLVLSGTKSAVPFAAQAQYILLAARSAEGVAIVLVDSQEQGVTLSPQSVSSFEPQCELVLDAVRVPGSRVISHTRGADIMQWIAQRSAAAICAHQLGASDCAMRMAAAYTSERRQFGVPVATFQAVGHRMADCYVDVECLRLTTYQAVSLLDSEASATTEVQIAKIWAGDTGHRVSYATQHVHGGTGIDRNYPLWRYCLWLRHNEMTMGCSAAQTAALGARLAKGEALFN